MSVSLPLRFLVAPTTSWIVTEPDWPSLHHRRRPSTGHKCLGNLVDQIVDCAIAPGLAPEAGWPANPAAAPLVSLPHQFRTNMSAQPLTRFFLQCSKILARFDPGVQGNRRRGIVAHLL